MREQRTTDDNGRSFVHREKPQPKIGKTVITVRGVAGPGGPWDEWENLLYYGTVRRYPEGFALGGGPWAVIGLSAKDETARHDWRHYQQIKNDLVGVDWEAVELYPAESRLKDPSNRFYLFCAPQGVFTFGFHEGRKVEAPRDGGPPQRPFP